MFFPIGCVVPSVSNRYFTVCPPVQEKIHLLTTGLPWSGKNIWKTNFFPGQGKVREFCYWPGKFRKDLESQEKVRKFENK